MTLGGKLTADCSNGVKYCEKVLVGKVLPRNQNLILAEFYEEEEHWCIQSQLESLEAVTCTFFICLRISAEVIKASLLITLAAEHVKFADFARVHRFAED